MRILGIGRDNAIVLLLAAALTFLSFGPSYGLLRFHDDWTFVYLAASAVGADRAAWFIFHPLEQHWSPAWHAIEVLNFIVAGWDADWFIRTLIALCTFLSLLVCASLLRALGVSMVGRVFGVATLALHHAAAAARFSFDTYSQPLADLLGWTAVACVIRALLGERGVTRSTLLTALALLTPALFLKEQALSSFLAIGLVTVCAASWRRDLLRSRQAALLALLVAEAAAFAAVRAWMGVRFQPAGGPFSLCATCAPVNIAELVAAVVMPVRTLSWFDALRTTPMATARLVLLVALSAAILAAVVAGAVRGGRSSRDRARAVALVTCALAASYFPVAVLGHVGELYTHTSLFWFAVLVACAMDTYWAMAGTARAVAAVGGVLYVASLGIGQQANLRDMRATGARARGWLTLITERLRSVPDGALVVIRASGPYKAPFDYGLYRLTTPQVLVLTGTSPYPVRAAIRDRLSVELEGADPTALGRIDAATAGNRAYRLELAGGDASVGPIR